MGEGTPTAYTSNEALALLLADRIAITSASPLEPIFLFFSTFTVPSWPNAHQAKYSVCPNVLHYFSVCLKHHGVGGSKVLLLLLLASPRSR